MHGRLLWHHDKEPRIDAVLDPSMAQFHVWLGQMKRDHGDFSSRELARVETLAGGLARRSRTIFNPFTGEIRRIDL